jgi:penicillin amidase
MYPRLFPKDAPLVALHWAPRGVAGSIAALGRAARATNVQELRQAMLALTTPATTFTAADTSGAIALFVTGDLPVRPHHLGTFPVPGWVADYEWTEMVDPQKMPFGVSTNGGIFAHANNLTRDPRTGEVFVHIDAAPSYRFDRITELLGKSNAHTPQTMSAIQTDVKLNRAQRLLPIILQDLASFDKWTPLESSALKILGAWDYQATADSTAASIFASTYREAIVEALQDEVDRAGFEFLMSQRYSTNVADLWFDSASHVVWDDRSTPPVETRRNIVLSAFGKAVARLALELGPDPAQWRWGRLHSLQIKHAFGGRASLAKFVNLPAAEVGGGLDSVWKSHFDLGNEKTPFAVVAGPAYRQIVDMADVDHAQWISDTGVSGWPGSPHYGDQHQSWKRGEFVPMLSNWDELKATAKAVVTLVPQPDAPAKGAAGK